MQTMYYVLYRYINPTTNTPITDSREYKQTEEFYSPEHKYNADTEYFDTLQDKGYKLYNYDTDYDELDPKDLEKLARTDPEAFPEVFAAASNSAEDKAKILEDLTKTAIKENNTSLSNAVAEAKVANDKVAEAAAEALANRKANYISNLSKECDDEREELITSNLANEDKASNLYVYTGTKKIYHKQFVPAQLGYKVRTDKYTDSITGEEHYYWEKVPEEERPSGPDDYSKPFVMLGGKKLGFDNAYLVLRPQYIEKYKTKKKLDGTRCICSINGGDSLNAGASNNRSRYHITDDNVKLSRADINKIVSDTTYFEFYEEVSGKYTDTEYGQKFITIAPIESTVDKHDGKGYLEDQNKEMISYSGSQPKWSKKKYTGNGPVLYIFDDDETKDNFAWPVYYGGEPGIEVLNPEHGQGKHKYIWGYNEEDIIEAGCELYMREVVVTEKNLVVDIIPEHYEDTGTNPYYMKDCYKKIELSPWALHSIHNSFESGLKTAKTLVSMIGIDNVSMVKRVPFDQFVKVK